MSSGLRFDESYEGPGSDVLRMLFATGDASGETPLHVIATSPTRRGSSHVEIQAVSSAIGELW